MRPALADPTFVSTWMILAALAASMIAFTWVYLIDGRRDCPPDWDRTAWDVWRARKGEEAETARTRPRDQVTAQPRIHVVHPDLTRGLASLTAALEANDGRMIA